MTEGAGAWTQRSRHLKTAGATQELLNNTLGTRPRSCSWGLGRGWALDLAGELCTASLCSVAINGSPWKRASEFVHSGRVAPDVVSAVAARRRCRPRRRRARAHESPSLGQCVTGDAHGLFLPA